MQASTKLPRPERPTTRPWNHMPLRSANHATRGCHEGSSPNAHRRRKLSNAAQTLEEHKTMNPRAAGRHVQPECYPKLSPDQPKPIRPIAGREMRQRRASLFGRLDCRPSLRPRDSFSIIHWTCPYPTAPRQEEQVTNLMLEPQGGCHESTDPQAHATTSTCIN